MAHSVAAPEHEARRGSEELQAAASPAPTWPSSLAHAPAKAQAGRRLEDSPTSRCCNRASEADPLFSTHAAGGRSIGGDALRSPSGAPSHGSRRSRAAFGKPPLSPQSRRHSMDRQPPTPNTAAMLPEESAPSLWTAGLLSKDSCIAPSFFRQQSPAPRDAALPSNPPSAGNLGSMGLGLEGTVSSQTFVSPRSPFSPSTLLSPGPSPSDPASPRWAGHWARDSTGPGPKSPSPFTADGEHSQASRLPGPEPEDLRKPVPSPEHPAAAEDDGSDEEPVFRRMPTLRRGNNQLRPKKAQSMSTERKHEAGAFGSPPIVRSTSGVPSQGASPHHLLDRQQEQQFTSSVQWARQPIDSCQTSRSSSKMLERAWEETLLSELCVWKQQQAK